MKGASLNKVGTGVKKTNIDFGRSTWNMEYGICLLLFHAGNNLFVSLQ